MEWVGMGRDTRCCSLFGKLLGSQTTWPTLTCGLKWCGTSWRGCVCRLPAACCRCICKDNSNNFFGFRPPLCLYIFDTDSHSCPSNGQRVHRWNEIGFWFCPRLFWLALRDHCGSPLDRRLLWSLSPSPSIIVYDDWVPTLDQNSLYFGLFTTVQCVRLFVVHSSRISRFKFLSLSLCGQVRLQNA